MEFENKPKTADCTVAALIINWNGTEDTIELLKSLDEVRPQNIQLTAVIIDNASSPENKEKLKSFIKNWDKFSVLYRENAINIGIPGAYNQAIQIVGIDFDYYLRLDNDVILTKNGLPDMIKILEEKKHLGAGIAGGNIKYYDKRDENNGGAVNFDLVRGISKIEYPESEVECGGVLGCIMLISGETIRLTTPDVFDSTLFIVTDESELSFKAKEKNIKTYYTPNIIGYHKAGRSTGKVKLATYYFMARNWFFLRMKYTHSFWGKMGIVFWSLLYIPITLIKRRKGYTRGIISGFFMVASYSIERYVKNKK